MIKAVLFDMDGVLVDSEEYICQAAIAMFREKGLTVYPEDFRPFVGKGENRYIGGVAKKYALDVDIEVAKARTYEIYEELVDGNLKALPGVHQYIQKAKRKNLKIAVATSADKVKMLVNLKNIGLSEMDFNATVNGMEVEHKKPAPDIFVLATKKLDLLPGQCLVVEDAVSGVEAAKTAGAKCLALLTSFSREELPRADWYANTLADASDEVFDW